MRIESMKLNMTSIAKSKSPLETFYKQIQKKYPQVKDVSQVLVGPGTYKKLLSLLAKEIKKECRFLSPKKRELSVGMNWLSYGPCKLDAIVEGYAVIRELNDSFPFTPDLPTDAKEN